MSRVVRGGFPDRRFDVDFWQQQGDDAIFAAAREMAAFTLTIKGAPVQQLRPDIQDFLKLLNKHRVRYLVVGGYAVMKYTEPFYTKEIDIWIKPTPKNAERAYRSVIEFGAPGSGLTVQDLTEPQTVFQFGVAPVRVDIMTSIDAVSFPDAWKQRVRTKLEGIPISVISLAHLKQNKRASDRDTDRIHLASLEKYATSE
jgi:hypothetical protein